MRLSFDARGGHIIENQAQDHGNAGNDSRVQDKAPGISADERADVLIE
jgi:hypothetical protein